MELFQIVLIHASSLVFTDASKIAQWYCWLALGFGAGGVKGSIPIDVIQKNKKEWEVANGSNKLYGLTLSLGKWLSVTMLLCSYMLGPLDIPHCILLIIHIVSENALIGIP